MAKNFIYKTIEYESDWEDLANVINQETASGWKVHTMLFVYDQQMEWPRGPWYKVLFEKEV